MSNNTERIINHADGLALKEGLEQIATAITAMSAKQDGSSEITSFKDIQNIVRNGLAHKFFSVGDQIVVEKATAVNATSSNSGLSVSVNEDVFLAKVGHAGTKDFEFVFDGVAWLLRTEPVVLSEYGISVTGTPHADDIINVIETASHIVMDVLGIDCERPVDTTRTHSLTLGMHYTFTGVQFSNSQALFVLPNGLATGSYSFTIGNYDVAYGGNATYYFTITQAIPAGGQIVFGWSYNTQASTCKISTFASPTATTAIESNISVSTTAISGATNLGTCDNGALVETGDIHINNISRARYGSNNFPQSAFRQWANSDKAKGSVWTSQSEFDRPPSWATTLDGFLHGLDPELVKCLGKVKKTTVLNNVCDGGGSVETEETCFAISLGELGVNGYSVEGAQYPYFKNLLGGTIADWSTHKELIKTNPSGSPQYWWLRSPYTGNALNTRNVYTSGGVSTSNAYYSSQAVLAFAII